MKRKHKVSLRSVSEGQPTYYRKKLDRCHTFSHYLNSQQKKSNNVQRTFSRNLQARSKVQVIIIHWPLLTQPLFTSVCCASVKCVSDYTHLIQRQIYNTRRIMTECMLSYTYGKNLSLNMHVTQDWAIMFNLRLNCGFQNHSRAARKLT